MSEADLPSGLYERVIDRALQAELERIEEARRVVRKPLDAGESHSILAAHLASVLERALSTIRGEGRLADQIALCNRVLALLTHEAPESVPPDRAIFEDARRLFAILEPDPLAREPQRPETPLSVSSLLTGTRIDPSLVSQIQSELLTADRVDMLCSFIRWSGIRVLADELREFASRQRACLRIITTPYMGATEFRAVEFLGALANAQLRVSYDTKRTRLHAKAYLFHRESGFSTAYIGSSNLSHAALTDGLEWNVKISQYETPHLWRKVVATFETYWNDAEFVPYSEGERERLRVAIAREQGGPRDAALPYTFDIYPYPFQQEILDRLEAERTFQGRCRNLVVAATGTGKTVIAAFDYRRFKGRLEAEQPGRRARLLFIAHREEILRQSLTCFRGVLRDPNFGDLWVGGREPEQLDHLFVSIQTYNSRSLAARLPAEHFDYVVVDEFHHAPARSYEGLLQHVRPALLLGLTATPERGDGDDARRYFDGHVSAEIRLPDAINRRLLCPFQYFGITDHDTADLSGLAWRRGGYAAAELDQRYTGNDARADLIVRAVRDRLMDPRRARGLGFCVSIRHAEYMAAYFDRHGIPAEALSAESSPEQRQMVQKRLIEREINFVFVVDLYNEGVDIRQVDTVLFLRPTESLTVFLQQLGRGLRHSEGKECLTVLDFIGQAHRSYNWEMRFRALMDRPKRPIDREIEAGCLHLPVGCVVRLERIAEKHVLDNIRKSLAHSRGAFLNRIATFEPETEQPLTLAGFLDHHSLGPDEVYQRGSWSRLCVRAGVRPDFDERDEETLTKGFRRVAFSNSPGYLRSLLEWLTDEKSSPDSERAERIRLMLHASLWGKSWRPGSTREILARLRQNPTLMAELIELLRYRYESLGEVPPPLDLRYSCPLDLHARYTRDEILAALGLWTLEKQRDVREGVLYISELKTDVFFVTLNKTETDYSPTTLYEDYAVSPDLFHWQSQSTTSEGSPTGNRYIHHARTGHTVLLFVREDRQRNGLTCPYDFLGPATYESHSGSRPMSILWRLHYPIPARLLPVNLRMEAA